MLQMIYDSVYRMNGELPQNHELESRRVSRTGLYWAFVSWQCHSPPMHWSDVFSHIISAQMDS